MNGRPRNSDPFDNGRDTPFGGGGGGKGSRFLSRVFEDPANPLGWSLRIFTFDGITVRIHLFTILFVVTMLLWSIPKGNAGLGIMALAMSSLMILVLLHEFGHCYACRYSGGSADRIVMLPIGGLALIRPLDHWRSHLISTVGGPAVNVALMPVTILGLWAAGLGSAILFNPLSPTTTLADPAFGSGSSVGTWAKYALWWFHYSNIVLLAFNVLIPAYPLDGGRILQAALWRKWGYHRATEVAVYVGIAGAMVMGVFGLVANESMLVVIAVFAAWACWTERRRLTGEFELAQESYTLGGALPKDDDLEDPWTQRRREKQIQAEQDEQAELDRVLAKIASEGMDSLSAGERKTLRRATEKKRKESE